MATRLDKQQRYGYTLTLQVKYADYHWSDHRFSRHSPLAALSMKTSCCLRTACCGVEPSECDS